ncbi:hypothetical protein ILUMI_07947 [Ignelater luminosus]|uniref:SUN domain-containing protein n=1 Tax=Ignelater luminosus TaxID=2038154 RepID=A0A8K0GFV5_IGNLU|nr:hypothetical protein ILUMI_07947 [Ignelater luminosus]
MSRRSLHSYDSSSDYIISHNKQTNMEIEHDDTDYVSKSTYTLRSRFNSDNWTKIRPHSLFSNNNGYSSKTSSIQKRSFIMKILTTVTSIFLSIFNYIGLATYSVYKTQNSIFIWLGKRIHQATTRIMYWDTWLLQTSNTKRKMRWLLALCLIPLLILGGWWLISGLGPLLYSTYNNISTSVLPSSFLFTASEKSNHIVDLRSKHDENDNIVQISPISSTGSKQDLTRREEKIITIKEKIILEPPKANEIAAELTSEQLQEIAKSVKDSLNLQNEYNMDIIIARILENPNIKEIIDRYNKLSVKLEENEKENKRIVPEDILQNQQSIIDSLRDEINKIKLDLLNVRSENIQNNMRLSHQLNRCCRNSLIYMESYITKIIKDLLGAPSYLSTQKDISDWLHATFVAKQDLEMHLANLTQHLKSNYEDMIRNNEKLIMDKVMAEISKELNYRIENIQTKIQKHETVGELKLDALTDEHIRKIVMDSIALYDADKTGLVDYALESAGGHILSTRCTESYQARTAVLSVFGIPLWYPSNTPRTVITPGVTPGECWAFQNFPGFLLIKLSAPVKITAFSMEHISKMLAPNGKIDSAPKEFSVYGLRNESDKEPTLLGKYMYDYNGASLQYFDVQNDGLIFDIIELRIHSNHGNPNYTCLYRFRVHGSLSTEPR